MKTKNYIFLTIPLTILSSYLSYKIYNLPYRRKEGIKDFIPHL